MKIEEVLRIINKAEQNLLRNAKVCPQCQRGDYEVMKCIQRYSIDECFKEIKMGLTKQENKK